MKKLKEAFKSVSSRNGSYSVGISVVVIIIAIVVNLLAGELPQEYHAIDLSSNNLYEVGDISRDMLKDLDKEITFKVIAEQDTVDTRIKSFIKKYAELSDKIKVEWIDSVLHPSVLQDYETEGNVVVVSCEETGKETMVNFHDIIRFDEYTYYTTGQIRETEFDGEGQLTGAVNYVSSDETKKVYRTSGHGEQTFSTNIDEMFTRNNIEVRELNMVMNPEIPEDCELLFMYAPVSDLDDQERELVEDYMEDGGKVYLILADTATETPNLDKIMENYGLEKTEGYIADLQRNFRGNYYAVIPELTLNAELSKGIHNEMVLMLNSGGMERVEGVDDNVVVTPFMRTSADGVAVTEDEEKEGTYILGAISEKVIPVDSEEEDEEITGIDETDDKNESKETETVTSSLTVLGSGSMIDASVTEQVTNIDNLTLFLNSVMRNFEDVENVAIEAKSLDAQRNMPLHAGTISIVIIFVIPLIVILTGFFVWLKRRKA